ncbi:hypothetical protein BH24ACI5_BH24ACI5_10710 [soil metagenome]
MQSNTIDFAHQGSSVFGLEIGQTVCCEHDANSLEAGARECRRLDTKTGDPESVCVRCGLRHAIVERFDPQVDVLCRNRSSLENGALRPMTRNRTSRARSAANSFRSAGVSAKSSTLQADAKAFGGSALERP